MDLAVLNTAVLNTTVLDVAMLDQVVALYSGFEGWLFALIASPWAAVAVLVLCMLDGFFPPVPGESVVVAAVVAAQAAGGPPLWLVLGCAMLGAWTGDQVGYLIGRRVGTERVPFLRTGRARQAIAWAQGALARRGATFIIAGRFIPLGRTAVNMTAGAIGFHRRRFMAFSAIAAVPWALTVLGTSLGAAAWLGESPLLAVVVGVAAGMALGFVVDPIVQAFLRPESGVPGEARSEASTARIEASTSPGRGGAVPAPDGEGATYAAGHGEDAPAHRLSGQLAARGAGC